MSQPTPDPRPTRERFGHATVGARPPAELETHADAPSRRRLWPRLLLGAVLVALLVGACFGGRAWGRHGLTQAWQLTRALPAGHRLDSGDVRRVTVSRSAADGTLPPGRSPAGLVTRTALPARALLGPGQLSPGGVVPESGQMLVGVAVGPGFAPAGLVPGMRVDVLALPPRDQLSGHPGRQPEHAVLLAPSTVEQVRRSAGGAVVTLVLPTDDATRAAELSAAGRIALLATGD